VNGKRYFKPLCEAGSTMFRHNNTRETALSVMDLLLKNNPIVLQIQEELSKPGATLEQTTAGSQLSADLSATIKKLEEKIKNMQKDMEDVIKAKDQAWQKRLDDELAKFARLNEEKDKLMEPPSRFTSRVESMMQAGAEGVKPSGRPGMLATMISQLSVKPTLSTVQPELVRSPESGMPREQQPNRRYLDVHGREEVSSDFGVEDPGPSPEVPSNSNSYTWERGPMGFLSSFGRKQRNRETVPPSPSQELYCTLCGCMVPRHEVERLGAFCSDRHRWEWEVNRSRR